jgi:hypothetical protein
VAHCRQRFSLEAMGRTGVSPIHQHEADQPAMFVDGLEQTAKTLPLTLTSTGTSAVTVNFAAITGTGFTIVAQSFPVTLNANQSVTLQVEFEPTTTGAVTGKLTVSSNSTTGGTAA